MRSSTNLEVKDKMEEAATALGKLESTSEVKSKALKTLEEGMKLLMNAKSMLEWMIGVSMGGLQ